MKNKRIFGKIEVAFDTTYLLTAFLLGIYLLIFSRGTRDIMFGAMALLLVMGDCFHLIPRIKSALNPQNKHFGNALAKGKLITSIGMTVFYVMLWHIALYCFEIKYALAFTLVIYVLAVIRIVLVAIPKDSFNIEVHSSLKAGIRNAPFVLMGVIVAATFFIHRAELSGLLGYMWLLIALSFAFYLPVVFGAGKYPMLGMLMLPKSVIYILIIVAGLH